MNFHQVPHVSTSHQPPPGLAPDGLRIRPQDNGAGGASDPERFERRVGSRRHEYVCVMTYLTDVSSDSPAFKVIPQTHTFVPEQGDLRGDDRGFAQLSPSGQVMPECCHFVRWVRLHTARLVVSRRM